MRFFEDALALGPGLSVFTLPTGSAAYDFDIRRYLPVRSIQSFESVGPALLRIGAIRDYRALEAQASELGASLLQSAEQNRTVAELSGWYPILQDLTPRSVWYEELPTAERVEQDLGWPVFVKGERQTNRHRISTSLARSRDEFERILGVWKDDEILHWQRMACREWVELQPVGKAVGDAVQPSAEIRCFFFQGQLVGSGVYWAKESWRPTTRQQADALRVAELAAERLSVPFVAVDVALTVDQRWIVIECNDAQESGYAGVAPMPMWQRIIEQAGSGQAPGATTRDLADR